MNTLLMVIIALLLFIIILLLVAVSFLIYRYFKSVKKDPIRVESKYPQEVQAVIDQAKSNEETSSLFCVDHPDLNAKGECAFSHEHYCELCLAKEKNVKVARKYLNLLLDSNWESICIINDEETGADRLNELYRIKKELWHNEQIPLIAQRQFKINIESDQIEAYTMVETRVEDKEKMSEALSFLKN